MNTNFDKPSPKNFCGCGYPDWLEVNLLPECNASCEWCVERNGWHPNVRVPWKEIADSAIKIGRKNVILLGGEPTLHPDIGKIIGYIRKAGLCPWVTTNGSLLSAEWVKENLTGVEGVNISVHHYNLNNNRHITGLNIKDEALRGAIELLVAQKSSVRLNCNCIKGQIDSHDELRRYIGWAQSIGATSVRFSELKNADNSFVDLAEVMSFEGGTNHDPFKFGCSTDSVIDGMPINFRQMCGMQTKRRPCPENPEIIPHPVLYYDGKIYDGWQQKKEQNVNDKELIKLLEDVKSGTVTVTEAAIQIVTYKNMAIVNLLEKKIERAKPAGGGSCMY